MEQTSQVIALNGMAAVETGEVAAIPLVVTVPAERDRPVPLIVYIPGYTSDRHAGLRLAHRLAAAGMASACIDPLYHGERYDPRQTEAARPEYGGIYPPDSGIDVFLTFLRVIEQSAQDVLTLLQALDGDPRLDVDRAGVTGLSMGAWASALALATIPRLRAAVPMMGVPTFTRRWLDLLDECAWSNPAWARALRDLEVETAARTDYVRSIDPAEKLKEAAPRALLLMNGDFDSDMPKRYVLDWMRQARPAWSDHPERLRWNVYPEGHVVTPQMEKDAVAWFRRFLLDDH